jgi:hypothetical protein
MSMKLLTAALVAGAAIATGAAQFPRIPPYLPVSHGDTVIMMTGSTNTLGYRIVVSRAGKAEWATVRARAIGQISPALTARLFSDLYAASPLDTIPHGMCMKSASFGTSLFVYWNHHRSPDVSCLSSERGKPLVSDAQALVSELHLLLVNIEPLVRPMLPGEVHKALPSAAPTSQPQRTEGRLD